MRHPPAHYELFKLSHTAGPLRCCRCALAFGFLRRAVQEGSDFDLIHVCSRVSHTQKTNSWTYNFVDIYGHTLESSQTWLEVSVYLQCYITNQFQTTFARGGGGGGPFVEVTGKKGGKLLRLLSQSEKRHIHRAGKAARLASWRKMTQPGELCWRWYLWSVFPCVRTAHFSRNETMDSLSTLTAYVLHPPSRVKSQTVGRGQWGMVQMTSKNWDSVQCLSRSY
jgi:hypothetical protein